MSCHVTFFGPLFYIFICFRMLDLTFQEEVIRKQDAYLVYWAVGNNEVGALIAWNFFRDNWDRIFKEYVIMLSSTLMFVI